MMERKHNESCSSSITWTHKNSYMHKYIQYIGIENSSITVRKKETERVCVCVYSGLHYSGGSGFLVSICLTHCCQNVRLLSRSIKSTNGICVSETRDSIMCNERNGNEKRLCQFTVVFCFRWTCRYSFPVFSMRFHVLGMSAKLFRSVSTTRR